MKPTKRMKEILELMKNDPVKHMIIGGEKIYDSSIRMVGACGVELYMLKRMQKIGLLKYDIDPRYDKNILTFVISENAYKKIGENSY